MVDDRANAGGKTWYTWGNAQYCAAGGGDAAREPTKHRYDTWGKTG